MSCGTFCRNRIRKLLTKEGSMILENRIPSYEMLEGKFQDISEFGLYLHIPFCRQICSYCPYNKELYHPEVAEMYTRAVKREIDFYSGLMGKKPVDSRLKGIRQKKFTSAGSKSAPKEPLWKQSSSSSLTQNSAALGGSTKDALKDEGGFQGFQGTARARRFKERVEEEHKKKLHRILPDEDDNLTFAEKARKAKNRK